MSGVPRSAGFTLIELMVALTVGGLLITSLYAIASATTGQFHTQQQVASTQTSLRNALNQVKRDIARAGFLATPHASVVNPKPAQTCNAPPPAIHDPVGNSRLAAFSTYQNNVTITAGVNDAIDPTGNNAANLFTADEIILFGNYETGSEYPIGQVISSTQIALPQTWHSFRKDFANWHMNPVPAPDFNFAAFQQAFAANRLIRIQTTNRLRHFAIITGTTTATAGPPGTDPTISFIGEPLPPPCDVTAVQGWVAPVNAMRYFVRNAPAEQAGHTAFNASTGLVGQLVRQEVMPNAKTTAFATGGVAAIPRVILDYVVSFNLSFRLTLETPNGQPDNYDPTDPWTNDPAVINVSPQRIRAVRVELAVRTPEQDSALTWNTAVLPNVGCGNMRCFQVFPTTGTGARPGAARVRRMEAEVFVPNVAIEGY